VVAAQDMSSMTSAELQAALRASELAHARATLDSAATILKQLEAIQAEHAAALAAQEAAHPQELAAAAAAAAAAAVCTAAQQAQSPRPASSPVSPASAVTTTLASLEKAQRVGEKPATPPAKPNLAAKLFKTEKARRASQAEAEARVGGAPTNRHATGGAQKGSV
jgi:hypothetical protein